MASSNGTFTVKSCNKLMGVHKVLTNNINSFWKDIWKARIHERSKLFPWRVVSHILPIRDVIWSRIQKGEQVYALCGEEQESLMHLFLNCLVTRAITFQCKWGRRLEALQCSTI